MAARLSTGAQNAGADTGDRTWLNSTNARLGFYNAAQPATGNTATAGTVLALYSVTSVAAPSNGALVFTFAAGTVATSAAGTPQSAVLYLTTEAAPTTAATATANTTTDKRIWLTVTATGGGGDVTFDNTTWTLGQSITLSAFSITQPNS